MKNDSKGKNSGGAGGRGSSSPVPRRELSAAITPPDDCTLADLAGATLQIELTLHKNSNNRGPEHNARWRLKHPLEHIVDHALNHIRQHVAGDRTEPHLAHAATRLLMALQLESEEVGK